MKRAHLQPSSRGRHDEVADERGQDPADCPEGLEDDHDPAADARRCVLTDERGRHGQLGAEAEADHEAQGDEHGQSGRQPGSTRRQAIDEQGDGEDVAATDPVGEQTAKGGADRHADEADRADPRELGGRQRPLLGQRRHDERDEPDVHRVERPADAGPDEQSPVLAVERQPVEPLAPGQPDLSWCGPRGHGPPRRRGRGRACGQPRGRGPGLHGDGRPRRACG